MVPEPTIARDPPCSNLSIAIEEPPIASVCLDDWIRFNQKLWVDLFWPHAFDPNQPFIFVDERLGTWANPNSTTGQNSQGDHIWIDVGVAPELINFQQLLADGTIDQSQYQLILNTDTTAAQVVAGLTNQDAGWQVLMHAWMLSVHLPSGQYMNLIFPHKDFDFKAGDPPPIECGPCFVPACECPDGSTPNEQQTQAYAVEVCNRICNDNRQTEVIQDDARRCRFKKVGLGALGIAGGCLGLICPSGVTQVAGGIAIVGTVAATADGLSGCTSTEEAAIANLHALTELYRQNRCLQACIASSGTP